MACSSCSKQRENLAYSAKLAGNAIANAARIIVGAKVIQPPTAPKQITNPAWPSRRN